ncbi:hypothetical protein [Actinoplanes sp. NPDC049265]|uniref:hypothetical protein n=1 Tax=Actinoplanes sp. NPDC049265 TaxID=3363902 RepID=UPI0037119C94
MNLGGLLSVLLLVLPAPSTAAGFTNLFQARNDWTWSGGDQVTSFRAGNGLTYWSFGDTVIGEEDPATGAYKPGWRMLPNTILVDRNGALGATTWEAAVPNAADGDRYWTQGMFQVGASLYVLCQRVRNTSDFFQLRGVELARFSFNADGSLAFQGMRNTPSTGLIDGNSAATAQYGADGIVTGGYVYVFGYANAPDDPYAPHRSYLARVPTGAVETPGAWRFRDASGAWVTDRAQAAPILSAQISSVRLIGAKWILAYKPWNGWGDTVFIESRATPWSAPTGTVTISSPAGSNYQTYAPQLHPEYPMASGRLLVSIAWNGKTLTDIANDADLYKPRFHEIPIP